MSEVEFNRLLDAVQTAITPVVEEDPMVLAHASLFKPLKAANDNGLAWPLLPFPEDWTATC